MAEKLRVHTLAKEIGVESKAILAKCRAEGLEVKNHMTALTAGLAATIREWFSEGQHATTMERTERVNLKAVRAKRKRSVHKAGTTTPAKENAQTATAVAEAPAPEAPAVAAEVAAAPGETTPSSVATAEAPPQEAPTEEIGSVAPTTPEVAEPVEATAPPPPKVIEEPPTPKVAAEAPESPPEPEVIEPAGPQNVPAPARLKGPRVIRMDAPDAVPKPVSRIRPRPGPLVGDAPGLGPARPAARRGHGEAGGTMEKELERARKTRAHPRRSAAPETDAGERIKEWRERDLIERKERMQAVTGRGLHARRAASRARGGQRPPLAAHKDKVQITEPIVLREFCAVTGIGVARLMPKMIREHNMAPNIAMTLPNELAQLLAMDFGVELEIIKAKSALDRVREEFETRERTNLQPRPPVVTFLGHVDHGKTSLLDKLRQSSVAQGESGGITQHIGAYRLDRGDASVTFLDTPGHQAFTAMRARGAQLTDVVVLVVAVDDGVMAQTIEAINHAKAAEVSIVVALNKIDLPGVDANRVYGQLAEQGLVPQTWGGEVDVIPTSAVTGEGLEELLEHLSTLSELMDLQADPTAPSTGVVIEAQMKGGAGAVARVLVMDGTLRPGAVLVCGGAFGKVRALTDYRGRRIKEAGPGTPVEVSGLSKVPEAGDRFYQVKDLQAARAVAEEVSLERRWQGLAAAQKPRSLEDLFRERELGQVPELNVIIRADVQGSVDVLRNTLAEFPSDQAKLNILHAGVGGITEGDVILAQASNAVILGFHVVADPSAERLASEKSVDVRLYRVIYNLTDDLRKALEGLLSPDIKEEFRGRAEVREIFRVSRVGTVAGCFVVEGVVARSHYLRVIREGRIVVPTEEDVLKGRHREVESLRRFKSDVREVRSGLECGLRVNGFDDVKVGDTIESYEAVKVARKLE